MKLPVPGRWEPNPELEGLLFFAQLLDEMVFDHSVDSYKVPALNTHLLTIELMYFLGEVENGSIRQGLLSAIIDELNWSLKRDPVAKALLGPAWVFGRNCAISADLNNRKDLAAQLSLLERSFGDGAYLRQCMSQLRVAVKNKAGKKLIRELTRCFASELILLGFSKSYIYYQTAKCFFDIGKRISSLSHLDGFFASFDLTKSKWEVIIRGSDSFRILKDVTEIVDVKVLDAPPAARSRSRAEVLFLQEAQKPKDGLDTFLVCSNIDAYDALTARDLAYQRITYVSEVTSISAHRYELTMQESALVYRLRDGQVVVLDNPKRPVHKRPDVGVDSLADSALHAMVSLTRLDSDARHRVHIAFNLHKLALGAESEYNQIINLWTALEALTPAFVDGSDKIEKAATTIVPVLANNYSVVLVRDLLANLRQFLAAPWAAALVNVPEGKDDTEKLMALLSLPSNEPTLVQLRDEIQGNPLLRFKLSRLSEFFGKPPEFINLIEGHCERVEWQLRRIYRLRNLIVHSGTSLPYIGSLVENLHTYLDTFVNAVLQAGAAKTERPLSLAEIVLAAKMNHDAHLAYLLQNKKGRWTAEDFVMAIVGP